MPGFVRQTHDWAVRRPLLTVGVVAVVVRLIGVLLVRVGFAGAAVPDARVYPDLSSQVIRGVSDGWASYDRFLYYETGALTLPITALNRVFGTDIVVAQLYAGLVGAIAAVLVAWLAGRAFGPRGALLAGFLAALLPTQIIWSTMALKDPVVWAAWGVVGVGVALTHRSEGVQVLGGLTVVLIGLLLLESLRDHSLITACIGLLIAAFIGGSRQRAYRGMALALVAVLLPALFGFGPLGYRYVSADRSLERLRQQNAYEAESAIAPVITPSPAAVGAPAPTAPPSGASPTSGPTISASLGRDLRYLPTGLAYTLGAPFPWMPPGSPAFEFARWSNLFWYPLLILAIIGLPSAWSRRDVLAFPVLGGAGMLLLYSLTEGNVGTAIRHRGESEAAVILLAVGGIRWLWGRFGPPARAVSAT